MRLRDFIIMVLVAGIFATTFISMFGSQSLEDNYGTISAHQEDNGTVNFEKIQQRAEEQDALSTSLQNQLSTEDEVSLVSIGSATIGIVKSIITFSYLEGIKDIFSGLQQQFQIDPVVFNLAFAIVVIIAVATALTLFFRWKA